MNFDLCAAIISHLDNESKCTGAATAEDQAWLSSIGLPKPLCRVVQFHWPIQDCSFAWFEVYSVASIREDEFTNVLLEHKFLNVGRAINGDWLVVDFSTEHCPPGFVSHEDWIGESVVEARPFFAPITATFEKLLDKMDKKQYIPSDYFEAMDYIEEIGE